MDVYIIAICLNFKLHFQQQKEYRVKFTVDPPYMHSYPYGTLAFYVYIYGSVLTVVLLFYFITGKCYQTLLFFYNCMLYLQSVLHSKQKIRLTSNFAIQRAANPDSLSNSASVTISSRNATCSGGVWPAIRHGSPFLCVRPNFACFDLHLDNCVLT